jgi:hypothetical protein
MYDDVTLCMMMWHCGWWCDTVDDDVTLCIDADSFTYPQKVIGN